MRQHRWEGNMKTRSKVMSLSAGVIAACSIAATLVAADTPSPQATDTVSLNDIPKNFTDKLANEDFTKREEMIPPARRTARRIALSVP
jgi:hypothetical protein